MEFALYVYSEAERIMTSLGASSEVKSTMVDEEVRLIKDCILVLEQDHQCLSARTEH